MMQPKKTKFRRAHKGRIHGMTKGGSQLNFGEYGLKALEPNRVNAREIEAARRAITREMKHQGRVWIRIFPDLPVSKKSIEVRMGSGKGAPNSLLNIRFQLSFAAMVMLVAEYEFSQQRKVPELKDQSWWAKGGRYVVGVVVTSIIAGLATMPYGAWHFNRIQVLGVLGNLIAVPLTGVVLMPAMLAAYVLMPLGLEAPALWVMGLGLKGVTASAAWVAGLPGASLVIERFSFSAVLLITFGGLWLCIWQTRLRLVGLVPIALGFVLMFFPVRPDVIVSAEGLAALRTGESYAISRAQGSRIVRENGSRAFAGGAELQALRQAGAHCDALGCVFPVAGQTVSVLQNGEALEEDCRRASLVIAPDTYVSQCKAPVIDARYLRTTRCSDSALGWQKMDFFPMSSGSYSSVGVRLSGAVRLSWAVRQSGQLSI